MLNFLRKQAGLSRKALLLWSLPSLTGRFSDEVGAVYKTTLQSKSSTMTFPRKRAGLSGKALVLWSLSSPPAA
jgi:hypothetical protein